MISARQDFKLSAAVFIVAREAGRILILQRFNTRWIDGYFFDCSRFDGLPYLNEPDKHDRLGWTQPG